MASTHISTRPLAVVDGDDDEVHFEEPLGGPEPSRYTYQPLPAGNNIRLLEVKPGSLLSTLQCEVKIFNLDAFNIPPYRALSYTWGDSKYDRLLIRGKRIHMDDDLRRTHSIRHPIWCGEKRLLISTNLRDVLRVLRHGSLPIKLWVDAVCINQEDDAERSSQILLMQRIYHSADQVWLWLGGDEAGSDLGIHLLKKVAALGPKYNYVNLPGLPELLNPEAMQRIGLPPFPSNGWESLVQIFMRPVFRRMWIIQELVTARKVTCLCGLNDVISYENIKNAVLVLDNTGWRMELDKLFAGGQNVISPIPAIEGIRMNWYARKVDVQDLVYRTRRFDASDPRDKIYALLGLLNDFAHRETHDLVVSDVHSHNHGQDELSNRGKELVAIIAEEKYQNGQAIGILRSNNDPRIVALLDNFDIFLECLIDFNKSLRHRFFGFKFTEYDYADNIPAVQFKRKLNSADDFHAYRTEIDTVLIKLREQLDEQCGANVSSDILCADRWVSEKIEDLKHQYNKVWARSITGNVDSNLRAKIADLGNHARDIMDEINQDSEEENATDSENGFESTSEDEESEYTEDDQKGKQPVVEMLPPSPPPFLPSGEPVRLVTSPHSPPPPPPLLPAGEPIQIVTSPSPQSQKRASVKFPSFSLPFRSKGKPNPQPKSTSKSSMPAAPTRNQQNNHPIIIASSSGTSSVLPNWLLTGKPPTPDRPLVTSKPINPWSYDSTASILPDYSLSASEVYRSFTLKWASTTTNLSFLSAVEDASIRSRTGLPSWVPDYSICINYTPLMSPNSKGERSYTTSGSTVSEIQYSPSSPNILTLQAYPFDSIHAIASQASAAPILTTQPTEWASMISTLPKTYPTGIPTATALWRTLIGDRTHFPALEYPAPSSYAAYHTAFLQLHAIERTTPALQSKSDTTKLLQAYKLKLLDLPRLAEMTVQFLEAMRAVMLGRRLFVTVGGLVGVGPASAKVGDVVVVMKGGGVPGVVRGVEEEWTGEKRDGDGGLWSFVGECYVQGVMDGEVLGREGFTWRGMRFV